MYIFLGLLLLGFFVYELIELQLDVNSEQYKKTLEDCRKIQEDLKRGKYL